MTTEAKKVKPLARITPMYEHDSSVIPERVCIPMDDGKCRWYRIEEEQPHPAFLTAMKIIGRMPEGSYQYKGPKTVKKRRCL